MYKQHLIFAHQISHAYLSGSLFITIRCKEKVHFFHYHHVILPLLEYYCNRNCCFFQDLLPYIILETQSERCWCWSCFTSSQICKSDMIKPSFVNSDHLVQKVAGGAYLRTTWWSHSCTFSPLLRKESGLKKGRLPLGLIACEDTF